MEWFLALLMASTTWAPIPVVRVEVRLEGGTAALERTNGKDPWLLIEHSVCGFTRESGEVIAAYLESVAASYEAGATDADWPETFPGRVLPARTWCDFLAKARGGELTIGVLENGDRTGAVVRVLPAQLRELSAAIRAISTPGG